MLGNNCRCSPRFVKNGRTISSYNPTLSKPESSSGLIGLLPENTEFHRQEMENVSIVTSFGVHAFLAHVSSKLIGPII